MTFENKVVVITGGASGIGKTIAQEFTEKGSKVCVIDILPNGYFQGDVGDQRTLEIFADKVITEHGKVDFLINNAPPPMKGINECTFQDFSRALQIGVTAAFYLTKLFMPHFTRNSAIVNISSTRAIMSQPQTESYTAAKGGISALTHALAASLAGQVRVNTVSPGWIDVNFAEHHGADAAQHPAGRVGNPLDIASMVLFLCSEKAGFITGQDFVVDGGMTRQMVYSGDYGWELKHDHNQN
ncbi:MAG: SDR family oxidoreductase [Defluviitaleaceae bacterium]|nr:SDR family oxidoreductase [Defluviitaleaceae bacterium]